MKKYLCLFILGCFFTIQLFSQTTQNKSPKVVAQKFYEAWHFKNKKAALKVADKEAVDKLFSVKWRTMKLESFKRREEGGFECIYHDIKNDLSMAMIVDGGVSVGGYNVVSVSFSSEE